MQETLPHSLHLPCNLRQSPPLTPAVIPLVARSFTLFPLSHPPLLPQVMRMQAALDGERAVARGMAQQLEDLQRRYHAVSR